MKQDAFKLFLLEAQPELLSLEESSPEAFEQLRFAFEEMERGAQDETSFGAQNESSSHLKLVRNEVD